MPSFLDELNDVQRAAVTHNTGAALVVAGPGSGKTRVLTYKIANLIEQGVAPWNILSLTFTNKSAKEMKERIGLVVGEARAARVWAGTFSLHFLRVLLRTESHAHRLHFPILLFTIPKILKVSSAISLKK